MHYKAPVEKTKLLAEVLRTGVSVTASRGVLLSRRHLWPQVLHPVLHLSALNRALQHSVLCTSPKSAVQ